MSRPEPAAELKHRSPIDAKGYTMLMNCVLYDPALSDGAKVTYISLLDYARQDDNCFPGQAKLAERRRMTERSVRNHLGELEKRGLIAIEQRGHMKTNIYWLEDIKNVYVPPHPQESDRKIFSGHGRQKISGHDRKNFSYKEDAVVKRLRYKKTEALNVSGNVDESPKSQTPNAGGKGIYAIRDKAVSELVALTGDEGSLRRFQQLWEIAEGKSVLDAWDAALRATRRRLSGNAKQVLARPGAYFDKICVGELEKREVFIPTIAEKKAEVGVKEIIRQELFGGESLVAPDVKIVALDADIQSENSDEHINLPPPVELTAAELTDELATLESQGGALYEAFQGFCETERKRYESQMSKVSPTSRERLLSVFDRPEKQRDLYRKWKGSQN